MDLAFEPIPMTAIEDCVIIKMLQEETVRASGLIIPDNAKEKASRGLVLAVGPGRVTDLNELIPTPVKVGDVIVYGMYGGTQIEYKNESYLVIRPRDIYAVIIPDALSAADAYGQSLTRAVPGEPEEPRLVGMDYGDDTPGS